jgi:hypothetical protein
MTTIIAAMQDSLLTLESSKTGGKTQGSLKGSSPQCLALEIESIGFTQSLYCHFYVPKKCL